jgi:hypothetical protein
MIRSKLRMARRLLGLLIAALLAMPAGAAEVGGTRTNVAIIPIEFQANDWATRKGFRYHARMDESTTASDLAPE